MARPRIPAPPPGTPARLPAAPASAADSTRASHGPPSGAGASGSLAARDGAGPRPRAPPATAGPGRPPASRRRQRRRPQPGGEATISDGAGAAPGWLLFRRIMDAPFETCLAALEAWPRAGQDGGLHTGGSRLRGPAGHDPGAGTCRLQVRLARGPLRPPPPRRLDLDRWSASATAVELTPGRRVRPTAASFRAGHRCPAR